MEFRQIKNKSIGVFSLLLAICTIVIAGCAPQEMEEPRHILMIAGGPSHGFGNHEHLGGLTLLSRTIDASDANVTTEVVSGWPENPAVIDSADAIIIFTTGGPRHLALEHLDHLDEVMSRGVGFATIHYGVEVPPGEGGDAFLEWQGGYFETHWSVNPYWTVDVDSYPDHPITNGVGPIEIRDEWYYHMRFQDNMENVTPILSDLPPPESLSRDDGPHSGNPDVRAAVLEREEPQHVAWAYERPGGGRGFGFTGGHYHWNFGHDEFRRLVANGLVWVAGAEVPEDGVPIEPVTVLELAELTDDPIPDDWDYQAIQDRLDEANGRTTVLD